MLRLSLLLLFVAGNCLCFSGNFVCSSFGLGRSFSALQSGGRGLPELPRRGSTHRLYSDNDGASSKGEGSDLPEKSDSIDWDEEWKKVKSGEIKPVEPGLAPVSETDKILFKVKNTISSVAKRGPAIKLQPVKMTSFDTGDWKFWLLLVLLCSFGVSFISAVSMDGGSMYENSRLASDLDVYI